MASPAASSTGIPVPLEAPLLSRGSGPGQIYLADVFVAGLGSLGARFLAGKSSSLDAKCGFKVVTTIVTKPKIGNDKTDGPLVNKIKEDTLEVRKADSTVTFEESPKGTWLHILEKTTADGSITTKKEISCLKENCKKECTFSYEWIKEKKMVEGKEVEVTVGAKLKCECPE